MDVGGQVGRYIWNIQVCIYVCMGVCMYACMYVCIYVCTCWRGPMGPFFSSAKLMHAKVDVVHLW